MGKVYNSSSSSGKTNFGWLNANYSFSFIIISITSNSGSPGSETKLLFHQDRILGPIKENMKIVTLPLLWSFKIHEFHMP